LSISSCRSIHADAAVGHDKRVVLVVGHDPDIRRLAVDDQVGPGDRLIAQLVAGVGSVGDQFAQEDVGLRIDRMHHQMQEFGNLGLKGLGFDGRIGSSGHIDLA
jgi:hypothetical protein